MIRLLNLASARKEIKQIELSVSPEVAGFLQNRKRSLIARLEAEAEKTVIISADANRIGESYEIVCTNERGSIVKF